MPPQKKIAPVKAKKKIQKSLQVSKRSVGVRKKILTKSKKKIISQKIKKSVSVPKKALAKDFQKIKLEKFVGNPIIEPRGDNFWEIKATFNPAALCIDDRIHLLYRAIGGDDVSTLGCAVSDDGVTVIKRSDVLAFEHRSRGSHPLVISPKINYCSGGGTAGGSEDPRLSLIVEENKISLTYTAFDGWGSVRIALSSITKDDFINQKWRWSDPIFLSPLGEVHKNWVLFPEKINGKFAIIHSISPKILIDYVDDFSEFEDDEKEIKSHYSRFSDTGEWDTWVRGVGPPPIRTRLGWLLFYHAMDTRDPNRYKLGAMILDANDLTKVLYRSRVPVLEPEEWYENTGWKSGVIYSCGAVVKDGELYVYYGGADSVVCVAITNLEYFLNELVKNGTPRLTKRTNVKIKK